MQYLDREQQDGIVTLTLNRPDLHNAFDASMIADLTDSLKDIRQDEEVRAVVLTGAGASFSAGADLNWMRSMLSASRADNIDDAMRLADLMRTLNYLPIPTIAKVNGAAFGGGVGLIACCDISIAAEHVKLGLTEAKLGLAPAVISPYVIRRIGETQARRYFLNGEIFSAEQACRLGLIQTVVAADQLDEAVSGQIKLLQKTGPRAAGYCKNLIYAIAGHGEKSQLALDEYTAQMIAELRISEEGQEGLNAFLDKRRPEWIPDTTAGDK